MEDDDEAVNVVKAVVQGRRRNAQDIRLALVDDNTARLDERLHTLQQPGVQQDAELGAALGGVEGRDDLVRGLAALVPQQSRFEVPGQADAPLTQGIHGGHAEDVERGQRGGHVQRGRVGQLEARGAVRGRAHQVVVARGGRAGNSKCDAVDGLGGAGRVVRVDLGLGTGGRLRERPLVEVAVGLPVEQRVAEEEGAADGVPGDAAVVLGRQSGSRGAVERDRAQVVGRGR